MDFGQILIYTYLPRELIKTDDLTALDMEEFLKYYAMALYARELRQDDISAGIYTVLEAVLKE